MKILHLLTTNHPSMWGGAWVAKLVPPLYAGPAVYPLRGLALALPDESLVAEIPIPGICSPASGLNGLNGAQKTRGTNKMNKNLI